MITALKGAGICLDPTKTTDANGFSTFFKTTDIDPVLLVEGTFPANTKFQVYFKGQLPTPTPMYSDYSDATQLVIDKPGKINLNRCPSGMEIGVKAVDLTSTPITNTAFPAFYIGAF